MKKKQINIILQKLKWSIYLKKEKEKSVYFIIFWELPFYLYHFSKLKCMLIYLEKNLTKKNISRKKQLSLFYDLFQCF
jgi:hypothetical protein